MKRLICFLASVSIAMLGCSDNSVFTEPEDDIAPSLSATAGHGGVRTYEVTIKNLTTGQPFSPGVAVTHNKRARIFRRGAPASEGIRLIAENGDPGQAVADLTGAAGFADVLATPDAVHRIGGPGPSELTFRITAYGKATRFSLAIMLICTNDGFVGWSSVRLPRGHKPKTYYAGDFDAGTERNDELAASIVPPCGGIGPVAGDFSGNDRTPTKGVVRFHRNIRGVGDLIPALHGWRRPVAAITIRRIG